LRAGDIKVHASAGERARSASIPQAWKGARNTLTDTGLTMGLGHGPIDGLLRAQQLGANS
jgi:hypothetical protein